MISLIEELDKFPTFRYIVCYRTQVSRPQCNNHGNIKPLCFGWVDKLWDGEYEINRCRSCKDDVNRQLKSYKNNQINKYILCLLVLDTIVIRDVSKVIIGKYYENYGILNV